VKALLEMVVGFALKRLVGPPEGRRRAAAPPRTRARRRAGGRRPRPAPARSQATATRPLGRPRGALVAVMLGALVVGGALMFFFEEWYTRVPAVVLLFTFVVSGVFVITGSGVLDEQE
jgi:hypothetical protein